MEEGQHLDDVMEPKYNPWYYKIGYKLYKELKPCLPGQQVHLKTYNGCFTVYDVQLDYFVIRRHRQMIKINWSNFRCLKGQGTDPVSTAKRNLKTLILYHQLATDHYTRKLKELKG